MALLQPARAISLRHQRVHAQHDSAAKDSNRVKKRAAQAYGANRSRAVWEPADHHGVSKCHGQPSQLSESQRGCQPQHGTKFLAYLARFHWMI